MSEHNLREILVDALPIVILALALAVKVAKMRSPFARGGILSAKLAGLCVDDPILRARLLAALEQRRKIESIPLSAKLLALLWACAGVGMLVASEAGIIPAAQGPVWYGVMCLGLAAIMAHVYFAIRDPQPVRVALLQARSSAQVIPPYWFAATCATGVLVLVYAAIPELRVAAILVCISSLATAAIAGRLTRLPARLAGNDIEAERFVDDGLRLRRAASVVLLAILQPYTFMTFRLQNAGSAQFVAWGACVLLFFAYAVWMARKIRCQSALSGTGV